MLRHSPWWPKTMYGRSATVIGTRMNHKLWFTMSVDSWNSAAPRYGSLACLWWSRIPTTGRYHGRVLQSLGRSNTSDCSPMKLVNVVLPCLVIGLTVNADPCKRVACLCFVIRIWLLFYSSVCFFICSVIVCVHIVSINIIVFRFEEKDNIQVFVVEG